MDKRPWFERFPDLAQWELDRFAANDLPAAVDERARAKDRFVVKTRVRFRGQDHDVTVRYPPETPELPPVVFGSPGLLTRHQNPFSGNFCLLERPLDDWNAHDWGAADLVAERLHALLQDTEAGPEAVRIAEAPMPEPFSEYYRTSVGPVVIVPGDVLSPHARSGVARLQLFDAGSLRLVLLAAEGKTTKGPLPDFVKQGTVVQARWKRLNEPPPAPDAASMVEWVGLNHPELLLARLPGKLAKSRHMKQPQFQLVGLLFPEEGPEVGETRDAWLFLWIPRQAEPHLIQHQVFSREERDRRIPALAPLRGKNVVILGLGTLGSPVALDLARAGVRRLALVDFDRFDVNNSVRHVLTTDFSGLPKTLAVGAMCKRANPFSIVEEHQLRFGDVDWMGPSSLERFLDLVDVADLVIDTTGSHQLQRLLGRLCLESSKPFVSSWLTHGFLGGHVARIVPGKTQCYLCFATAIANVDVPLAEAALDASVTAQGCSHPTTTGAGFDASELAAITSRLAVQTLLQPTVGDDHIVANFYRSTGDAAFPRLASSQLPPTDGCDGCQQDAGSAKMLSKTS